MSWSRSNKATGEPKRIDPRPLTEREASWISEILSVDPEWRDADISRTRVVAEGFCYGGISIRLGAPAPEKRGVGLMGGEIGRLWIGNDDNSIIEVRLSQSEGRLDEVFILFVDPKDPQRTLPEKWTEVSHQVIKSG